MAYLDKAITKLDVSSTGNQYFTFVNSSIGGPEDLKVNANIAFNPSLNTFIVEGNLMVNGTTTTLGTQDLVVEDKNIIIGNVGTPSDITADGGGITLKGTTDKTFNWVDSTDSWTSSENINLATGKIIKINGANILSATNAYVTANYSVDSDKLDGQHGSYYLNASNFTNKDPNYSSIQIDNTDTEFVWVSADATSVSPSTSSDTLKFVGGSGTNFAIDATNKAIRVSHSDTSSQASVNNSGRTYIQDVTLDGFGHVTGLVSATETVTDTTYVFNAATNNSAPALQVVNSGGTIQSVRLIQAGATTITQTNASAITISSANTTYTNSGTGLTLTGTTFAHADTSSVANVSASGRTYITGLTFDEFGHVSGTSTGTETVVDTNTTYTMNAATVSSAPAIQLYGSDSTTNPVRFIASGGTTITQTNATAITISTTAVGNGTLILNTGTAGSGTAISITNTGLFSANDSSNKTYTVNVGPAISGLSTIMNGATTGALRKSANDTFYLDSAILNSASTLDASKLSGTIPSAVLGNSNVYIGNTSVALNRSTGVLSLAGVNIDGNAGYATTAGSTTNSITAGNGITGSTFNGGSAQTWSIVSAAGSAGTIGTISVAADTVGVSLGTTSTVAAAGNHGHGNILTGGTITAAAVAPANTDYILISDASNSGKVEKSIAIGTGTTTYLRNDGTWASPPDTNTDTLQSISNIATAGTYYPSFVSATGAVVGYIAQDKLTFNPSTGVLSTTYLSGAMVNGVTTVTASTYTADKAYPIILADATTPASITIGLPAAASSNGLVFRIKKIDGSEHQVIIDANGTELIDGAEKFTLIYQYQAVDLACNGTAWYIL